MKRIGKYTFIAGALSCALLFFAVLAFAGSLADERETLLTEAREDRRQAAEAQAFLDAHLDRDAYYKTLSEREKRARLALPSDLEKIDFTTELAENAEKSGLKVLALSEEKPHARGNGLTELTIKVTLEGDYFALMDFLDAMEKSDRFAALKEAKISTPKDYKKLRIDLKLSIYSLNLSQAQKDVPEENIP